jgi:DNA-binding transcriptional MerR regulator
MNSKYNLGIYPFNNAAKILKVDSKNLNSWVKRYLLLLNEKYKNKFYKEVDTERYHNRSIAFLDLIEFRFIKECENRGLRLQEIKKAAQWLIERFETPFPFANEIVLNFLKTN